MNNQEAFNKVCEHLAKQKTACYNDGMCKYWDKETGNKCGVGCLIPEELYDPEMDNKANSDDNSIATIIDKFTNINSLFENVDILLLLTLQEPHDSAASQPWESVCVDALLRELKTKLYHIAKEYNLDSSCVELITEWY